MKKWILRLMAAALIVAASAAFGLGLLLAVHALPAAGMRANLERSKTTLVSEGKRAHAVRWCHSSVDNSTNSKMLLIAAYDGGEGVLERTLMNYRHLWEFEDGPSDVVPGESTVIEPYGRYWHGYELWLRPMLLLTDLAGIRRVNLVLQAALALAVCLALARKGRRELIVPCLALWGVMVPFALWRSLTLSCVYYITFLGLLYMIVRYDRLREKDRFWAFYLMLGILVGYFDFLTYPLAALCAPLALQQYFCRRQPAKGRIANMLRCSAAWAIGYVGIWACKWLIGALLGDFNFIGDALSQVAFRSSTKSTTGGYASVLLTWVRNLGPVAMNPLTYVAMLYGGWLAVRAAKRRSLCASDAVVFGLIALMPFVWYAVFRNHSYVHVHFTSKALAASAFALLCMLSVPDGTKKGVFTETCGI